MSSCLESSHHTHITLHVLSSIFSRVFFVACCDNFVQNIFLRCYVLCHPLLCPAKICWLFLHQADSIFLKCFSWLGHCLTAFFSYCQLNALKRKLLLCTNSLKVSLHCARQTVNQVVSSHFWQSLRLWIFHRMGCARCDQRVLSHITVGLQ